MMRNAVRNDFYAFVEKAFQAVSPGQTFRPNWHLEAICYRLSVWTRGDQALIILMPPRNFKSICASVAFPAWLLARSLGLARAGKPTIHAVSTKEALFAAVAMRNAANVRAGFESNAPAGATVEERLASVGTDILKRLLVSHFMDFMRLSIAEARRFPDLANVGRLARERGAQAVTQVLGEVAHSDEIGMKPKLRHQSRFISSTA